MHPINNIGGKEGVKNPHPRFSKKIPPKLAIPHPIKTPRTPAINPRKLDSKRNIEKISEFRAPTALITPISLTLSRTEVIMVFAVLTAETKTEIKDIKIIKPIIIFREPI
jgi:hypothetical protein